MILLFGSGPDPARLAQKKLQEIKRNSIEVNRGSTKLIEKSKTSDIITSNKESDIVRLFSEQVSF